MNCRPLMSAGMRMIILVMLGFWMLSLPDTAKADPYFNSAEPGCNPANPNPNYLMCDDWEDGTHIAVNNSADPANDGWWLTSIRNMPGGAACGGGAGLVGTNCSQRNILILNSDGSGSNAYVSTHGWYQDQRLDGYRMRFYFMFRPGYVFGNSQKFLSGQDGPHTPGIVHFGLGRNVDVMELCPVESCNNRNGPYLQQNQGNNITLVPGKQYYFEVRFVLNTPGVSNGIFQMWINDCGATGICTGSPILRESRSDVLYRAAGDNRQFGGIFLDIWGNPSDGGTLDIDQLIVARDSNGLIGFMGATGNTSDITPPAAPVNLRIQ